MRSMYFSILVTLSLPCFSQGDDIIGSTLETVSIQTGLRTIVHQASFHYEAPNWSVDGKYFIINSRGKLYKIPATGGDPVLINTGFADDCNNDHGISPDGKWIVISHTNKSDTTQKISWKRSTIYILPIGGGIPRKVTELTPSFWHGWSPDGKTLAYCAERNGNFDVYSIGVKGGLEKRLTNAVGLDDGPEYSHDGKFIYYNSFASGRMHIWRMNVDGSKQVQITNDELSNWFPHSSPDGKWIVFISYIEDQGEAHPFGKNVKLRLLNLQDNSNRDLTDVFYGGQGTINVPSWSPDSKQIAFISYRTLQKQ